MSNWYVRQLNANSSVWFYSERGLMTYFFNWMALHDIRSVLENCLDLNGSDLKSEVGQIQKFAILNEFDLGATGFGCPDGAFYIEGEKGRFFVFIEAKHLEFLKSFRSPKYYLDLYKRSSSDIYKACRKNGFNSRINGQLELRWRFANAVQSRAKIEDAEITEQLCPPPLNIRETDRFYWLRGLQPEESIKGGWRRVNLSGKLNSLLRLVSGNVNFKFLAITNDYEIPLKISEVRLFDRDQRPVDTSRSVYWLSLSKIKLHMRNTKLL